MKIKRIIDILPKMEDYETRLVKLTHNNRKLFMNTFLHALRTMEIWMIFATLTIILGYFLLSCGMIKLAEFIAIFILLTLLTIYLSLRSKRNLNCFLNILLTSETTPDYV